MNDNLEAIELTQESIESMIYVIRNQKVMLDFDLARIYGYSTKAFNQQVKRNIDKFPSDFMFQLNEIESEKVSWSQNVALNKSGNSRGFNIKYLPKAFTEQGVYMLMTVLKGELAIKQSLALIRLFKQMKDYIVDNRVLLDANSLLKIPKRLDKHDRDIRSIKHDLKEVMSNFIDPNTYKHFLIMNGEKVEAEEAYEKIYSLAKQSIIVIDDYISERTLRLMKHVNRSVSITIFSDNVSKDFIIDEDLTVFEKEYGIKATLFLQIISSMTAI